MNDREALVLLNMLPSIGSILAHRLSQAFRPARMIFRADEKSLLSVEGMTHKKVRAIKTACDHFDLAAECAMARKLQLSIVTIFDDAYPTLLKEIYDPPIVLYVAGSLSAWLAPTVAIVGSRRASHYGMSTAHALGTQLAEMGVVIVSGLARGIDTSAHRAAVQANAATLAVLGSGFARFYPSENKMLAEKIVEKGGTIISEYPCTMPPLAHNFPRRNRIISGLSLGVVVIEAAHRSGALITARTALEQSREVFAVPGTLQSQTSAGTHALIKQGAKLVTSVQDIIEELPLFPMDTHDRSRAQENDQHLFCYQDRIYHLLSAESPRSLHDIHEQAQLSIAEVYQQLLALQLENKIEQLPGQRFIRKGL